MTKEGFNLTHLPRSWVRTKLGEIGFVVSGGTPSTKDESNFNGSLPWVTPADLSSFNGKYINKGRRNLSENGLKSSSATMLPTGSIIFSSRAPIGYVAIAANPLSTNQGFKNLVLGQNIFNEYVFYYLKASKGLAKTYASGTTFLEVSGSKFAQIPIPLPPLPEQHRIVAKIEELFTDLDAGLEALKKAKEQLKRYRQAVLKAAFEGKLTEAWREAHKGELEPASALLERMREEQKRLGGPKYKEPSYVDTTGLPQLPESWRWVIAEQSFKRITDGEHITPERSENGVPLLSARNVQNGWLSFNIVDYVPEHVYQTLAKRLTIEPGDVLLSCSGSVGRSCVAPEGSKFALVRSVAVLKPFFGMGRYFSYCIRSLFLQGQIEKGKTQTAQANIFQEKIRKLQFPLPPLQEQIMIVHEIDRHFSVADSVEEVLNQSLMQSGRLRQSILKQAFEGKLVPQDPTDEPTEKLLERINAERAHKQADNQAVSRRRKPQ